MSGKLTDPKDATGRYPFEWVDSRNTNIRATFKRARRELLERAKPPRPVSVIPRKESA